MSIKQLSISLTNVPGTFCTVSELLGREGVNIRAISVADTSDISTVLGVVRTDNASHRVHPAGVGSILPQQLPAPPVRGVPAEAGLVVHHGAVGADDIEAALLCGGEGLARVGRLVESHLADAAVCPFGDPFGGLPVVATRTLPVAPSRTASSEMRGRNRVEATR